MWFSKPAQEALKDFKTDPQMGLTEEEAASRLARYGPNKLAAKPKKSLFRLFFEQLNDMLIYVLLAAALTTFLINERVDAVIILLVIIVNAAIGVFQEYKAEKAIEALAQMASPRSLVKRGGEVKEIDSSEVVPGDLIVLDAGRQVPADVRLISSSNLQIEESALTGESVASEKDSETVLKEEKVSLGDQVNMAFMSTLVTYGRGEGVVVAHAMDTEMGKIARILDEDEEQMTPLQRRLDELGKTLGYLAIGICVLIFVVGYFQNRAPLNLFLTAISLAVAAIPEGLPAIVAIVLALGVTRMSKINAIVKKLPAVETLGSVNIVCSDKTGTLTQNKMTVVSLDTAQEACEVPAQGSELGMDTDGLQLIHSLVLCSDATYENGEGTGDPTEVALVALGERYGIKRRDLHSAHERVGEFPFDSERKLMSTLTRESNGYRIHTKGAIDNLLSLCSKALVEGQEVPLSEELRANFLEKAEALSNRALRVLAGAYRDTDHIEASQEMERDLTFLGMVGMIDPPRLEVKDAIAKARTAGITPVMITGDHRNTAVAIAKELGIANSLEESMTGKEIDEIPEEQFNQIISKYRVFARVSPEHKVKIVRAFKSQGNTVSMTGDGVNDAPSLKFADIGVAMGITGTDVSKGASDMILTDDNFTTIIKAIEEGRNIYNNIKKAVIFLLSCNLGEVISVFLSVLFFWPVPLLPTQLLWINLITDTFPAIALGVDPGSKDVMLRRPRNSKESFFAHGAAMRSVIGGTLIGLLTLTAFYWGIREHGYTVGAQIPPEATLTYARTMAFVVLAVSQLFYSLSMRHYSKSILQIGLFTNKYLIGAIILGIFLQGIVISVPFLASAFKVTMLTPSDWLVVFGFSLVPLVVNEGIKKFFKHVE